MDTSPYAMPEGDSKPAPTGEGVMMQDDNDWSKMEIGTPSDDEDSSGSWVDRLFGLDCWLPQTPPPCGASALTPEGLQTEVSKGPIVKHHDRDQETAASAEPSESASVKHHYDDHEMDVTAEPSKSRIVKRHYHVAAPVVVTGQPVTRGLFDEVEADVQTDTAANGLSDTMLTVGRLTGAAYSVAVAPQIALLTGLSIVAMYSAYMNVFLGCRGWEPETNIPFMRAIDEYAIKYALMPAMKVVKIMLDHMQQRKLFGSQVVRFWCSHDDTAPKKASWETDLFYEITGDVEKVKKKMRALINYRQKNPPVKQEGDKAKEKMRSLILFCGRNQAVDDPRGQDHTHYPY